MFLQGGMDSHLFTCCGSPAYAAPELVAGKQYVGAEVFELNYIWNINNIYIVWGTGIRGLMKGMAILPQGNQELLEVRDKVGRPQVILG